MSCVRQEQAQGKWEDCIKEEYPEAGVVKQQVVLMGESRECSESSTEACDEQHLHLRRKAHAPFREPKQDANQQATCEIDGKCAPRKHACAMLRHNFTY